MPALEHAIPQAVVRTILLPPRVPSTSRRWGSRVMMALSANSRDQITLLLRQATGQVYRFAKSSSKAEPVRFSTARIIELTNHGASTSPGDNGQLLLELQTRHPAH
ncbi:hypothetical protein VTK73DRAFT_10379 [Phialemonium thermophilum]|uniref:Uncharacterized protein n=1 Tax=Phialemonium thermophilum TaxID=223376 RepID=A0ABR3VX23_9PEZI